MTVRRRDSGMITPNELYGGRVHHGASRVLSFDEDGDTGADVSPAGVAPIPTDDSIEVAANVAGRSDNVTVWHSAAFDDAVACELDVPACPTAIAPVQVEQVATEDSPNCDFTNVALV